jgi:hypothetical protein
VARAHEDDVAACLGGGHRGFAGRPAIGEGLHLDVVRDDDAPIPQLFPEQLLHHAAREGRRRLLIQLSNEEMARHEGRHSGLDGHAERTQLHVLEAGAGVIQGRERQVGIHVGVAMAREVLGARRDSPLLEAADHRDAQAAHELGVIAEGAIPDHRILRVRVDVKDRGQVPANPASHKLGREGSAHAARQLRRADAAQRPQWRPQGPRLPQPRDPPALLVDGDEQRQVVARISRQGLDLADEVGDLFGRVHVAREENDAADVVVADQALQVRGSRMPVEADDDALAGPAEALPHLGA